MLLRPRLGRAALAVLALFVALLASAPTAARAQQPGDPFARLERPDDVVMLKDGTVYRGRIVERVPGDHVTIVLEGGTEARFAWRAVQQAPPAAWASDSQTGLRAGLTVAGLAILAGGGMLLASPFVKPDDRGAVQLTGGLALGGGFLGALTFGFALVASSGGSIFGPLK